MIPEREMIYEPICKLLLEKGKQKKTDINEYLIKIFNITLEELSLRREFSSNKVVYNTIGWALDTLQNYGLIINKNGYWQITDLGKKFTSETKKNFVEEMKKLSKNSKSSILPLNIELTTKTIDNLEDENPLTIIELGYSKYLEALKDELLTKLYTVTPDKFEQIVCDLLEAMDYGETKVTGRSSDGGIDGEVFQDKLQIDIICLQAKRYQKGSNVAPEKVRDLSGAVTNNQYKAGILITTSDFSQKAREEAEKNAKIKIINGSQLVDLMVEYQVGLIVNTKFPLLKISEDYFSDE